MSFTRLLAISVIGFGFGTGALQAQNLSAVQAPAELPPASYRGAQYVDSKGCVFIRAGIDGNISWVPRVNRQRELICGQTPTLSGAQRAIAPDPTPPTVIAEPATPAPAPQAAPRKVATNAPAPRTQSAPAATVRRAAPVATAKAPVAQPKAPAQKVARQTAENTSRVLNIDPQTRVVPRHVHENRPAQDAFKIPKGYRTVWEDDRLNPRRAEQSIEGIARTRLIWTQTVPRRLLDRVTGEDMTAQVALVHPFTDTATQERELGNVTLVLKDGQLQKRIVRNKAKARAPTISTRSSPEPVVPAKVKANAKGRYVQVGTYGEPANAQAAAQRIIRAGLTARIGKVRRGGKNYQVVVAGPFATTSSLSDGLRTTRAAGFIDAFVK